MASKALYIIALVVFGGVIAHANESYRAIYSALAPGDDPNTRGSLRLLVRDVDPDAFEFSAELYNALDVTGIHLHLEGNSSGGLFGGPLFVALTNTTAANGQSPVSSNGDQPLRASGRITSEDLNNNFMLPMVQARVKQLGLDLAGLGINLDESVRVMDLEKLINADVVYGDVHTLKRVSPQGLTRGRVSGDGDYHHPSASASASAAAAARAEAAGQNAQAAAKAAAAAQAYSNGHNGDTASAQAAAQAAARASGQNAQAAASASASAKAAAGRKML